MSFPEDAYSTNPIGASEQEVAETIVAARKSWKTVKGKSEPVWPPALEKALVKALLQYKPSDSRYARALGRFPKRNRFISDFIFEETGVRRSPKQVGSRLQQLKDVGCGKQLLNHVASWSLAAASNGASGSSNSNVNNLNISIHNAGNDNSPSSNSRLPHGASYGDLKTESSASPSLSTFYSPASSYGSLPVTPMTVRREVFISYDPTASPMAAPLDLMALEPVKRFTGCLGRPETVAPVEHSGCTVLPRTKPCVVFTAREPIAAYAMTTVRFENGERGSPLAHSRLMSGGANSTSTDRHITQKSPLICTQMPNVGGPTNSRSPYAHDTDSDPRNSQADCFMYTTDLTNSRLWDSLIRDRNLCKCIITQDLICQMDNSAARRGEIFLSITYRFSPLHPPSPAGSMGNMHGPLSPTSSSSGSTHSSPLSGSPQSTVHAQLPSSYPASYQGSGGNYNFQQPQYNGGYDGYVHHVPQMTSHSPHMGALKTSPRLDMHMQPIGGHMSFALENVVPSPILSPGGTPPSFPRMGTGLPTASAFNLDYDYDQSGLRLAASPIDGHFGMGPTLGL